MVHDSSDFTRSIIIDYDGVPYQHRNEFQQLKQENNHLTKQICFLKGSSEEDVKKICEENIFLQNENIRQRQLLTEYYIQILKETCTRLLEEVQESPDLLLKLKRYLGKGESFELEDMESLARLIEEENEPEGFQEEFAGFEWVIPSRGSLSYVLEDFQKLAAVLKTDPNAEQLLETAQKIIRRNTVREEDLTPPPVSKTRKVGQSVLKAGKAAYYIYENSQKVLVVAGFTFLAKHIPWLKIMQVLVSLLTR